MEFIIILAAAVLAIQIALESELAYSIKRFMRLDLDRQKTLHTLSRIEFWISFFGIRWQIVIFPLIVLFCLFFSIMYYLNKLFNCQYCLSFHIAWTMLHFIHQMDLVNSLIYGTLSIIATKLIEKLNV